MMTVVVGVVQVVTSIDSLIIFHVITSCMKSSHLCRQHGGVNIQERVAPRDTTTILRVDKCIRELLS